jgi:hypothetical protein
MSEAEDEAAPADRQAWAQVGGAGPRISQSADQRKLLQRASAFGLFALGWWRGRLKSTGCATS